MLSCVTGRLNVDVLRHQVRMPEDEQRRPNVRQRLHHAEDQHDRLQARLQQLRLSRTREPGCLGDHHLDPRRVRAGSRVGAIHRQEGH